METLWFTWKNGHKTGEIMIMREYDYGPGTNRLKFEQPYSEEGANFGPH